MVNVLVVFFSTHKKNKI